VRVDHLWRVIGGSCHEHETAPIVESHEQCDSYKSERKEQDNAPVEHSGILPHNQAVGGYHGGMASMDSVRQKFYRVRVHYDELLRELTAYYDSMPDTAHTKIDPETKARGWMFPEGGADVPARIGLIVGDCIQNLRSSLDYLVWELVLASGNEPTQHNAFPVAYTIGTYKDDVKKRHRLDGVRDEAIAVIDRFQPFQVEKSARKFARLWILDYLANVNKHRRVLLTGWNAILDLDTVQPISFKIIRTIPPWSAEDDRIMAFVGLKDGSINGMEVAAFVDAMAQFIGDVVLPAFEQFFE
jgi:hypothetical protein